MARTSNYEAFNQLTQGRVGESLEAWRADGLSYENIARRLEREFGISVTGNTIQRWLDEEAS